MKYKGRDSMAEWQIRYFREAKKDLARLDHSQQILVTKAIRKVSQNPLPQTEGGYGKPLRGALANLLKIKLRDAGLRVVYRLVRTEHAMQIIVISIRSDDTVYKLAEQRLN